MTGMTRSGKIPSPAEFEPRIFRSRGGRLNHKANEALRERERERERERFRQTDRQTKTGTDRQRDRDRQTDRQTDGRTDRETDRQTDRYRERERTNATELTQSVLLQVCLVCFLYQYRSVLLSLYPRCYLY